MGRYALLLVMALAVSYSISSVNLNNTLTRGVENSVEGYTKNTARNISRSMSNIIIDQLSLNSSWRETTPVSANLFEGDISYLIKDVFLAPDSLVEITVNASYNNHTHESITFVKVDTTLNKVETIWVYE